MRILAWPGFENKTGNPYTRLLYEAVEAEGGTVTDFSLGAAIAGRFDVWHVHWPDDFLSIRSLPRALFYLTAELVLMAWGRVRGASLVWTVHDLGPHEHPHPALERFFWRLFLPLVDGFLTLSEHAKKAVEHRFPALRRVPGRVVPHGHYREAYPEPVTREAARSAMGLPAEAQVWTYVGRIRPYKNVDALVRRFREVEDPDARLVVAGNPISEWLEQTVREAAGDDDRITLRLEFVPDAELARLLGAADLVVLPYEDIMHSGTALLALSLDRPVLVPDRGAMSELRERVGDRWVRLYRAPLTAETLREAQRWAVRTDRPERAPLEGLAWDGIARATIALYREATGRVPVDSDVNEDSTSSGS